MPMYAARPQSLKMAQQATRKQKLIADRLAFTVRLANHSDVAYRSGKEPVQGPSEFLTPSPS